MTLQEAQRVVHDFRAETKQEAEAKAMEINARLIPCGDSFVAVNFGTLGWSVMLASAYNHMRTMGILM